MRTTRYGLVQSWRGLVLCTTGLLGCGPIVSAEEGNDTAGSANAVGASSSGTGMPDATPPVVPACAPGEQTACTCPSGGAGSALCEADGALGPCGCDDDESSGGWASTGAGTSEESGWVGSSGSEGGSTSETTSGGPPECLPLDEPCPGVSVQTNAEVEAIAACSRIEGSLHIRVGVTDLSSLTCLRELGNQLYMESVDVPNLAALSNLQHIEGELELLYNRMTSLSLPSLESVAHFSLYQNNELLTLDLPSLTVISGGMDVHDNLLLSTCDVASLAEEAASPTATVFYDGNADDCPSSE